MARRAGCGITGAAARRLAAAAALLALACAADAPGPAPRPDVLLVVLDTVRADRTSTDGYGRPTTIQLDALASAGVVFEDVTSPAAWTWPSHASLFTGEPPWVHGAHMVSPREPGQLRFAGYTVSPLREDLPTLAERFSGAGYRTVSLAVNDWLGPELGLVRGFQRARVLLSDARLIVAVRQELRRDDPRPLFLFVNLVSAHSPYRSGPGPWGVDDPALLDQATAPAPLRPYLVAGRRPGVDLERFAHDDRPNGVTRYVMGDLAIPPQGMRLLSTLYDAGVRGADFALGQVLEAWAARDREGIVAVASDHGEALGEHGMLDHKGSVYPEVLRVPLVVAAPGRLPAGRRVAAPVQLHDLHDTLLDLAGVQPGAPRSLAPAVRGEATDRPISAAAWPDPLWAHYAGGRYATAWRLYRRGDEALVFSAAGDAELYDLASDPGMTRDLAAREPARVAALLAEARRHFGAERAPEARVLEIPAETLERLRRLGYAAEG